MLVSSRITFEALARVSRNQSAYIKSFNGRLPDKCLSEHWFTTLSFADQALETWRLGYGAVSLNNATLTE